MFEKLESSAINEIFMSDWLAEPPVPGAELVPAIRDHAADMGATRVRGFIVFIEPHSYRDGGLLTTYVFEDKGILTKALESRPEVWGIVRRRDRDVHQSQSHTGLVSTSGIDDVVSEF